MGSMTLNPNPCQDQETVIADKQRQIGRPGIDRSADELVSRLLMPARRGNPDAAETAMPRRADPEAQLPARRPCSTSRVIRLDHRLPQPSVSNVGGRIKGGAAERPAAGNPAGCQEHRQPDAASPFAGPDSIPVGLPANAALAVPRASAMPLRSPTSTARRGDRATPRELTTRRSANVVAAPSLTATTSHAIVSG